MSTEDWTERDRLALQDAANDIAFAVASGGDKPGRGLDRMNDEHWSTFVGVLLDSYHKTMAEREEV
jgi:hypothetical protein